MRIGCFINRFRGSSSASAHRLFSRHERTLWDLEASGPMASHLRRRAVIRFRGPDTVKFLQGILTNDMRRFGRLHMEATGTVATPNLPLRTVPPVYAALLTPQGRFMYDLFIYQAALPDEMLDITGSGPGSDSHEPFTLFADVDAHVLDELLECFKKYRLRSKVEIDDMSKELSCWQRFGGHLVGKAWSAEEPEASAIGWGGTIDPAGVASTQGNNLGWQWFKDPRLASLGFRGVFPSDATPPLVEADKECDEELYLSWRLKKGVAEGSSEIPKGEAIPLEYNLAGLNAISFEKGCYVGQELIARTHHCGIIRKRLLPFKFVNDGGKEVERIAPGSDVVDTENMKKAGTVETSLGCCGMGVLRLEKVFKATCNLKIRGQEDVRVMVVRPDWWPAEWLPE